MTVDENQLLLVLAGLRNKVTLPALAWGVGTCRQNEAVRGYRGSVALEKQIAVKLQRCILTDRQLWIAAW